ncbi:uncharacterized protein LOC127748996 [Frankliniella occidentalis]|uniref:Uncharacterized protein LOC127748996 n=1 Tax=Frankliniella occidentalis TaxID=133901 RepID=A0A9C6TRT7_FRAOC|nr:uncharacterized protein LOC127748996 [Frankliniella occidentalis]
MLATRHLLFLVFALWCCAGALTESSSSVTHCTSENIRHNFFIGGDLRKIHNTYKNFAPVLNSTNFGPSGERVFLFFDLSNGNISLYSSAPVSRYLLDAVHQSKGTLTSLDRTDFVIPTPFWPKDNNAGVQISVLDFDSLPRTYERAFAGLYYEELEREDVNQKVHIDFSADILLCQ